MADIKELENRFSGCKKNLTVAIMGCAVNGPGEAREADIGVAGGKRSGILFKKGKPQEKVAVVNLLSRLIEEINRY